MAKNEPVIDLYCIQIYIPSSFDKGIPKGYFFKSIGAIMDDNIPYELLELQEWFLKQIMDYVKWDVSKPLTQSTVKKCLVLFHMHNIKPTGCIYMSDKESK